MGRDSFKAAFRLRFSRCEYREFTLRLCRPGAITQSRHDIPVRFLQVLRVWREGNPEVHQGVDVIVRLLRGSRRWEESYSRRHHPDHSRRHVPPADTDSLSDDLWVAAEGALPAFVPEEDDFHWSCANVRFFKTTTEHGLESHHLQIVFGDSHAFDRLAAVVANQKIEQPGVGSNSFKRLRLFLPIHPLLGGPATWALLQLAVGARRRNQHQLLGIFVGRRG